LYFFSVIGNSALIDWLQLGPLAFSNILHEKMFHRQDNRWIARQAVEIFSVLNSEKASRSLLEFFRQGCCCCEKETSSEHRG